MNKSQKIISPNVWPTHKQLSYYISRGNSLLEIGPGSRPRLPLRKTVFIDNSQTVVENLQRLGAEAIMSDAENMPFEESAFDLVGCFNSLSNFEDDQKALREMMRVVRKSGKVVVSVPLQISLWSVEDEILERFRRYDPQSLLSLMEEAGLSVERYWLTRKLPYPRSAGNRLLAISHKYLNNLFSELEQDLAAPFEKFNFYWTKFLGGNWREGDFHIEDAKYTEAILVCSPSVSTKS